MSFQTKAPEKGDLVAVMHTNMGDIKIKLFPNEVPKTVKNFVELSKKGYYNGIDGLLMERKYEDSSRK